MRPAVCDENLRLRISRYGGEWWRVVDMDFVGEAVLCASIFVRMLGRSAKIHLFGGTKMSHQSFRVMSYVQPYPL